MPSNMSSISTSDPVKTPTLSKRSDILIKIAITILSPLLLIGLLEGLAYVWERGQANGLYAWELVASRRMVWEPHPEPGAGYTLIKPGSHYEWQGIPVDINSHGLRGPETTYEKPPATFRILNLGDSVAMGWGVREENTYGQQLEALLNEQGKGDLRYEVINAGVPGWNLENDLAYLQAEGLKYEPDLILLDMNMPKLNGLDVLDFVKKDEKFKRIPVVMLTTSSSESDVLACYDKSANCFITKPLDFGNFINVVEAIESFWFSTARLPKNTES